MKSLSVFAGFPITFSDIWLELTVASVGIVVAAALIWVMLRRPFSKERRMAYILLLVCFGLAASFAALSILAQVTGGRSFYWQW